MLSYIPSLMRQYSSFGPTVTLMKSVALWTHESISAQSMYFPFAMRGEVNVSLAGMEIVMSASLAASLTLQIRL